MYWGGSVRAFRAKSSVCDRWWGDAGGGNEEAFKRGGYLYRSITELSASGGSHGLIGASDTIFLPKRREESETG